MIKRLGFIYAGAVGIIFSLRLRAPLALCLSLWRDLIMIIATQVVCVTNDGYVDVFNYESGESGRDIKD